MCFHGNALFQRERMPLFHILLLLSNNNLYRAWSYIAYSDAWQFIVYMCQIWLVYVSLRKRYISTLSYFWLTLVAWTASIIHRARFITEGTRMEKDGTCRTGAKIHIIRCKQAERQPKYIAEFIWLFSCGFKQTEQI